MHYAGPWCFHLFNGIAALSLASCWSSIPCPPAWRSACLDAFLSPYMDDSLSFLRVWLKGCLFCGSSVDVTCLLHQLASVRQRLQSHLSPWMGFTSLAYKHVHYSASFLQCKRHELSCVPGTWPSSQNIGTLNKYLLGDSVVIKILEAPMSPLEGDRDLAPATLGDVFC